MALVGSVSRGWELGGHRLHDVRIRLQIVDLYQKPEASSNW